MSFQSLSASITLANRDAFRVGEAPLRAVELPDDDLVRLASGSADGDADWDTGDVLASPLMPAIGPVLKPALALESGLAAPTTAPLALLFSLLMIAAFKLTVRRLSLATLMRLALLEGPTVLARNRSISACAVPVKGTDTLRAAN